MVDLSPRKASQQAARSTVKVAALLPMGNVLLA